MNSLHNHLDTLLGLSIEPRELSLLQLGLRSVVVFTAALLMLRLAHKRFFAGKNAIDVLLTFILASTLSRAINGSAPFFGTIAVGFFLVILHTSLTWTACRFHGFGKWLKGNVEVLVRDGQVDDRTMQKHHISLRDLNEDLRLNGGVSDLKKVAEATLERNGEISVRRKPRVVTIDVAAGVQTVRIELES